MTAATRDTHHGPAGPGRARIVTKGCDPAPAEPEADPATRAAQAGITAVWTGDCSGSVELARLAGPRDGLLTASDAGRLRRAGRAPWSLADPAVRAALYEHCLICGTQFDIYRWVNLADLAAVWHLMRLPAGIGDEWGRVLVAARLLETAAVDWTQSN